MNNNLPFIGEQLIDILESDFGFKNVVHYEDEKDSHAFYFEGIDNDLPLNDYKPMDIKVRVDTDDGIPEVWCRDIGSEDWIFADTIEEGEYYE